MHFWQAIKDLKNDNVNEVDPISAIDNSTWHDYFSRSYSSRNHLQTSDIESSTKLDLESCSSTDLHALVNRTFTIKEIKNAISKLKTGKSPGVDMILNEMLKLSQDTIAKPIAKIFKLLFDSQLYRSLWSKNMLLPSQKGGEMDDPDNCSGISISSCSAKLYSLVLNERLIDAIEKFDLISQEQIGFLKGFRTTDHSFIINSTVNKNW